MLSLAIPGLSRSYQLKNQVCRVGGVGVAVGEGAGEAAAVAAGWAWRGAGEEAVPGLAATGPPTITTKAAERAPRSWRWRPGRMSLTIVRIAWLKGKRISSCPP